MTSKQTPTAGALTGVIRSSIGSAGMSRAATLLAALVLALAPGGDPALAQQGGSGGGVATKENLDLPFDAFGVSDDEEDAPEVIFFYGQQYEGDGFFFCLDRSSSTANGELAIEKRETIRSISQFSRRVQFAIVFYDQGLMKWPSAGRPAEANGGMKAGAIAWLSTINSGHGTCVREGLLQAIAFANRSSARRNVIIYLGDGGTTCPNHDARQYGQQTLSAVAGANYKRHQINSICVGTDLSATDQEFCKQLAAMNNGTFKVVPR